jgi:phosphatidate phosphatase PAH1
MQRNRKTIFCDIDGTLFEHKKDLHAMITKDPSILPGVIEKFSEWRNKDYYIILTTARPEGCRNITEKQLASFGIFYDRMIMGLPVGPRVVINDKKPDGLITSYAVCIERNDGLKGVKV